MMEQIFHCFWHFIGTVILIYVIGEVAINLVHGIIRAFRK